ncbi:MAG: enoyl-CoA hydratase/isomerase family protein [Bacteroidales bacterium]|nr:enoyl-CoA hydratase/isomerase family protein [Bacteroidales bacterium]
MSDKKNITWEVDDSLGILTLNNPPENYLINPEFVSIDQLKSWLKENIKGLIITGAGRHFSGGADLNNLMELAKNENDLFTNLSKGNDLLNYIDDLEIPVVAAISGVCFGGGLEIALSCDIRICTERSMFAFPEINHDLIPGIGGVARLERLTGKKTAMDILFSGDTINARKALELKIVDYVIPKYGFLEFSKNYLNKLVENRPIKVINMLMRSLKNSRELEFTEAVKRDVKMFCELAIDEAKKLKNE